MFIRTFKLPFNANKKIFCLLGAIIYVVNIFAQINYSLSEAQTLGNYAFHLYEQGKADKAIEYEEKALKIGEYRNDDKQCAISLLNLSTYNRDLGYYSKALAYAKKSLSIQDKYQRTTLYIHTLSELSSCYQSLGEYDNALIIMKEVISAFDSYDDEYYHYLLNLSNCYYSMGDFDKSIEVLEEILEYEDKINIEDSFMAMLLENLAMSYQKAHRLRDALWSEERAFQIATKIYGENHIRCAESMYFLGYLYLVVGNRSKAISLGEKAARIIKMEKGSSNIDYINALRMLSLSYTDYDKKLAIQEKIMEILKNPELGDPQTLIYSCGNIANSYAKMGEREKLKEVETFIKNNGDVQKYFNINNKEYASYQTTIAECYYYLGDYNKSIELGSSALDIFKELYGDNVLKYENCILGLFMNYVMIKDSVRSISLLKETQLFDRLKKELQKSIDLLSYQNRVSYWKVYSEVFCNFIPIVALATNEDLFVSQAYNISALWAKGFLLKTEIEMSDLIKRHGDLSLNDLYMSYISNKSKAARVYEESEKDSISKILINQEDIIWQTLNSQNLIDNKDYSWNDIQRVLKDDDIAIEFISFHDSYSKQYDIALLLRSDYKAPKQIYLENGSKIKEYYANNDRDSIFTAIWGPLMDELSGINNIYFSPSGQLYNIPIEYLSDTLGRCMSERYNIYRLSSTQRLLPPKKGKNYSKSALYGGLDYDKEATSNSIDKNKYKKHISIDRGLEISLSNRSGFDPLPNTAIEVSEIGKIISASNIECETYMGKDGTEESFKNLSGCFYDIIHIATHGMYIGLDAVKDYISSNNFTFIDDGKQLMFDEDAALSRSFLVMSRGNSLPKHFNIPSGADDGILTAQEIANVDLKNVDLVVLSSCQSGLGDINDEGVYGLQRAFKKAGANTILMSLDKVDDEATKILMVEFYKNLMSGKTKHQSLKDAQKHLRQVDNGKYDKLEYWASFIMLDGLN